MLCTIMMRNYIIRTTRLFSSQLVAFVSLAVSIPTLISHINYLSHLDRRQYQPAKMSFDRFLYLKQIPGFCILQLAPCFNVALSDQHRYLAPAKVGAVSPGLGWIINKFVHFVCVRSFLPVQPFVLLQLAGFFFFSE